MPAKAAVGSNCWGCLMWLLLLRWHLRSVDSYASVSSTTLCRTVHFQKVFASSNLPKVADWLTATFEILLQSPLLRRS